MKRGQRLEVLAALVALAPLLVSFVDEVRRRYGHPPLAGDYAFLELYTRRAMHGVQWTGPYSRFGWAHPGPLYFYLLVPFHLAFGDPVRALYVGAVTLALGGAAAALWLGARMVKEPVHRAAGVVAVSWALHGFCREWFTSSPWNPTVTTFPFLALVTLAAWVSKPGRSGLAALIVLHAFVTQTHVGNVPIASVIVLTALAFRLRTQLRRRDLAVMAIAFVVAWSLPLAQMVVHPPGNLAGIASFFSAARDLNPKLYTVGYTTKRIVGVHFRSLSIRNGLNLLVAVELALVFGAVRAAMRTRNDAARFAVIVAVTIVASFAAATRITGALLPHLTPANPLLLPLAAFAIAWTWLPDGRGARAAAPLIALVAVVPLAVTATRADRKRAVVDETVEFTDEYDARDIGRWLTPLLAHRPHVRLVAASDSWAVLAGAMIELQDHGIRLLLDPHEVTLYGSDADYAEATGVELVIHEQPDPSLVPAFKGRVAMVGLKRPAQLLGHAAVLSSQGVTGDPHVVTDGIAAEGSLFDAPAAVRLAPRGNLTLQLDPPPQDAYGPVGVRVVADHNDSYGIEGSLDGTRFFELGAIGPVPAIGLRARDFYFDEATFPFVRVRPREGDGLYAVSEVAPIYTTNGTFVLHFGIRANRRWLLDGWSTDERDDGGPYVWALGASARVAIRMQEGRTCRAMVDVVPLPIEGRPQTVTVEMEGRTLSLFSLSIEDSRLSFEIPAALAHAQTEITFRFGYAVAPHDVAARSSDRRALAVAFRKLVVCPPVFTPDDLR